MALGLLAGSLFTEVAIFIPFWKRMDAREFLSRHHTLEPLLFNYFAPLTVTAVIFPLLVAVSSAFHHGGIKIVMTLPSVLTLAILAIYFGYFSKANASFKSGSVGDAGLASELVRWERWNLLRAILCLIAFVTALYSLTV